MSEASDRSVFILTGAPRKVVPVIQYLKNRGWDVHWSSNLRESLGLILKLQPKYILLSVEFSHPKIRVLPKILAQAVSSEIIPFAENQSTTNYNLIQSLNATYTVFPPVSGPAVERTLLRIQRDDDDQLRKAQNQPSSPKRNWALQDDAESTSVSGYSKNEEESDSFNVQGLKSPEQDSIQLSAKQSSNKVHIQKGTNSLHSQGPALEPPANELRASSSDFFNEKNDPNQVNYLEAGAVIKNPTEPPPPNKYWNQDLKGYNDQEGYNQSKPIQSRQKGSSIAPIENTSSPQTEIAKGPQLLQPSAKQKKSEKASNSILDLGTSQALDEEANLRPKLNGGVDRLDECSNVFCIIIESPSFSGYLIAALGSNRTLDERFMAKVKIRLIQFLKTRGQEPEDENTLHLRIKEVQFEDWALDYAEFLRKSVHNGEEVAMAFFPRADIKIELPPSEHKDMLTLDIGKMATEVPLEFNAYIYLTRNSKFILYTGKNRILMTHQKERLKEKGVTHFYIHKDESSGVKQFYAQNYLNSKIKEFEEIKQLNLPSSSKRKKAA